MTDWFRATSGEHWHADVSRLRTFMMDFVERFTSGRVWYHNFWDHPYGREETGQTFVRKLSRATLHLRVLQRRYRNLVNRRYQNRVRNTVARGYVNQQSTAAEFYKRLVVGREGRWLFPTPTP